MHKSQCHFVFVFAFGFAEIYFLYVMYCHVIYISSIYSNRWQEAAKAIFQNIIVASICRLYLWLEITLQNLKYGVNLDYSTFRGILKYFDEITKRKNLEVTFRFHDTKFNTKAVVSSAGIYWFASAHSIILPILIMLPAFRSISD